VKVFSTLLSINIELDLYWEYIGCSVRLICLDHFYMTKFVALCEDKVNATLLFLNDQENLNSPGESSS
jgi:hypothetical protein